MSKANTVICPNCGKILTELFFTDSGTFNIATKSETEKTVREFSCSKCNAEMTMTDLENWGII